MAKKGRRFVFHGAFGSKAAAKRKEDAGSGRFIRETRIKGNKRYLVLSRKKG
jgi:hypothetical protein